MHWPKRSLSTASSGSDASLSRQNSRRDSADSSLGASLPAEPPGGLQLDDPGLSRIFTDAALFEQVITSCPSFFKDGLVQGGDDKDFQESFQGFTDLVGRDLDESERAVSGRLAQLSVNNWASSEGGALAPELDLEDAEEPTETPTTQQEFDSGTTHDSVSPPLTTGPNREDSLQGEAPLQPQEIVDLLTDEFGALAPPGEEKLLLECDATLFRDVVILGVVHVTTHRLTFHASLLSSSPSLSQQIVKAGPVFIHRKGLHRKQRVWLELTHDMISTFRSSRDEDRIKPLRSVLLSSVKHVHHTELKYPRHLHITFEGVPEDRESVVEFDTEESARDWRRELHGAVFLYRRNRRSTISGDSDEDAGVRINIPLTRITEVAQSRCLTFAYLVSLTLSTETKSPAASISRPSSPSSFSGDWPSQLPTDLPSNSDEKIDSATFEVPAAEKQVLQLAIIRHDDVWTTLMGLADQARERSKDGVQWPGSRVFVDFDPRATLNDADDAAKGGDEVSELKLSVARTLALDATKDMWVAKAHVHRFLVSYFGRFAVNVDCVGFYSSAFSKDVKYRVPLELVKEVKPVARRSSEAAVTLVVQGHSDLTFVFHNDAVRTEAIEKIKGFMEQSRDRRTNTSSPTSMTPGTKTPTSSSRATSPHRSSSLASPPLSPNATEDGIVRPVPVPKRSATAILAPLSRIPTTLQHHHMPYVLKSFLPKAINVAPDVFLDMPSKHFVCLTIGSRGDVQPYIALGLGLQKEGHKVTIVTHEEYKAWIVGFGLQHRTAGGDPGALMKLSMFSPQFFKESIGNFRTWLDDLLVDSWEQCQDADVLLESPSAMAGVHIAEALHIPYFRTFTMPWTKTRQFPHAFLSPPVESPTFNAASYVLFDNVLWTATSSQINRWRKKTMHIGPTDMGHLAQSKIPFIYNFSQAVVPKPLDWGDATAISGYWFLDNPDLGWTPPPTLITWMEKARKDEKPIVYIGFGSIVVPNPNAVTKNIIKAVQKSGVRAIISKGWSARMAKPDEEEVVFPEECYPLEKVPHDWLFPQIDAALHHGGAGTTGASLRAGIPTLIRPWFGDQFFWASRMQKLGVGLKVTSTRASEIADALTKATTDRIMKEKAASVGERIREENGVQSAIHTIYTYLPRAGQDRKHLH
ncbi:UDP-Glycosyltransferase/glycogen phosphorylase [Artomyces pyxidatus]|uniref:UDP-Glycosyltransferase/glycogen phosphorylase n=1 Tax=Artomyces pyxidatus TaxID=48021 RepID=A0ACB8SYX1_9AGAM|nr:UDP-Glycosyltransferase/glycogen phosphorylase [Artomyces pyxidatus]